MTVAAGARGQGGLVGQRVISVCGAASFRGWLAGYALNSLVGLTGVFLLAAGVTTGYIL